MGGPFARSTVLVSGSKKKAGPPTIICSSDLETPTRLLLFILTNVSELLFFRNNYEGRLLLIKVQSSGTQPFHTGMTSNEYGPWKFEGVRSEFIKFNFWQFSYRQK